MHPTKPSNTQVYSPLGSFVVEEHNDKGRTDALKLQYRSESYGREKGIALAWLLMFVILIGGSIYNRLGRPDVTAATSAEAATTGTASGTADRPQQ